MDMTSLWGRLAKLQSFFQDGLNVDESSHLPEADLRKISLGNLYVYQQQGVLNTFETGVTPSVRKVILGAKRVFGSRTPVGSQSCRPGAQ